MNESSSEKSATADSRKAAPASPRRLAASALPRGAIVIGLVSLLADISTEMIYPLLPTFLTETLGAPKSVVGLIEGVAVGTALVVTSFSGMISDRIGRRRPLAFAGYALTAASRPLIALAGSWPVVMGARFADRLGKGIRSAPKDALLADSVAAEARGRAYGFERAMDYSGAVAGPLIGLLLLALLGSERVTTIFLISTVPAAAAALLILSVGEKRDKSYKAARSVRLTLAGTTREYRRLLVVAGVFGLANSANAFLILRAESLGLTRQQTILAYALYNAVASLVSMPAGAASDRFGRRNLLIVGYTIYAVAYAGFGAANAAWVVWPLFALYGLFPGLTDGVAKALAVDTAGSAGRATAIGLYAAVSGVTQVAASYAGGLLWDKVDARATFYFGAALAAIAVLLIPLLLPSGRDSEA